MVFPCFPIIFQDFSTSRFIFDRVEVPRLGRRPPEDRGEPPEGAPDVEEIEQLISERNACRKRGDYSKAWAVDRPVKEL